MNKLQNDREIFVRTNFIIMLVGWFIFETFTNITENFELRLRITSNIIFGVIILMILSFISKLAIKDEEQE